MLRKVMRRFPRVFGTLPESFGMAQKVPGNVSERFRIWFRICSETFQKVSASFRNVSNIFGKVSEMFQKV